MTDMRKNFVARLALVLTLGMTTAALAPVLSPAAHAETLAANIEGQLRSQGFTRLDVHRTWLGRIRIEAYSKTQKREIVLNPRTGEILRDYWRSRTGGPEPHDKIFNSNPNGNSAQAAAAGEGAKSGSESDHGSSSASGSSGPGSSGSDTSSGGSGSGSSSGGSGSGASSGGSGASSGSPGGGGASGGSSEHGSGGGRDSGGSEGSGSGGAASHD